MNQDGLKPLVEEARRVNLLQLMLERGYRPSGVPRDTHAMFHAPFRDDRHPSFSVSQHQGVWGWYDFGTGEHGDVIAWVMRHDGLSFKEALARLTGHPTSWTEKAKQWLRRGRGPRMAPAAPPVASAKPEPSKAERIAGVRRLYLDAQQRMGKGEIEIVVSYFARYQLPVNPQVHAVVLSWQGVAYLGIPIPSLTNLRGLECRAILPDVPSELRRRTFGQKTLWVLKHERNPEEILITESVMDCLAGDQMLNGQRTLVALNGIANVEKVTRLVEQLKPKRVFLAFDNDPDQTKGQAAEQRAADLLAAYPVHVERLRIHHEAGVKDLAALWIRLCHQKKGEG